VIEAMKPFNPTVIQPSLSHDRETVQEQQQRHHHADDQPGQGVEDQHPGQGGHGGDEVGPGGDPVDAAELAGGDPPQGGQGRDVDQLDHGRDHHRGQGRMGAGARTGRSGTAG
jgi:hypothetical protein